MTSRHGQVLEVKSICIAKCSGGMVQNDTNDEKMHM